MFDVHTEIRKRYPSVLSKYRKSRSQAKKRGLDWDLELEAYEQITTQPCHYCAVAVMSRWSGGLDRIDNSEGYYEENVLPCCGPCNQIRGDNLTVEEMEVAMSAVLEFRQSRRTD